MHSTIYYALRHKSGYYKGQFVTLNGVSRTPTLDSVIETYSHAEDMAKLLLDVEVVPVTMSWDEGQ